MSRSARTLYLTPLSHFSRKVRIVLLEIGLDCENEYAPNLLSRDPGDFGGNPILRVPVLRDGPHWVVESDSIVRYLLETYDPGNDRFEFFRMGPDQRNALSFISAVMGAEVELILSRRSGLGSGQSGLYFERYREVIRRCLGWVEGNAASIWPRSELSYLDVALVCMWDHLRFNDLLETPGAFAWIAERASSLASRPSIERTSPGTMKALQWQLYPSQRPADEP